MNTPTDDQMLKEALAQMLLIREFEEEVDRMFARGQIRGTTHLAIGQEAVAVGSALALAPQDLVFSTYRGHHHNLARGMEPQTAMAEMLGRRDGCCGGKGGSMHLTDIDKGLMGSFAIVGGHIPLAVGAAWASKLRAEDVVTCCFFGDGTTTIGAFHEALNLAAVWQLPIIFVCENNLYSEYTPIHDVSPVARPAADRAAAYGLPPIAVDGNDLEAVRAEVSRARSEIASGNGPVLIEAETYRQSGHSRSDPGAYRPEGELEAWVERDPISRVRQTLQLSEEEFEELRSGAQSEIARAAEAALASPEPDVAALTTNVYAEVQA